MRMTWIPFIKSKEGRQILWLDYCGYHLTRCQSDLTILQTLFLAKGRLELYQEMNKVEESKI